ncbi:MAG: glycosyltransferase family 39 protein [Polyangiaceae bacterium]
MTSAAGRAPAVDSPGAPHPPGAPALDPPGALDPPKPHLTRADLAWILGARVLVSALVIAFGFRAVSDDDFSRVVIAEQFALAPKLDPSGTSWLPFPFWLTGAVMGLFGSSLLVARIVAVVLGLVSSWLVAESALRMTGERRTGVIAGCACALVGWSAWLGVATVPELFTAALTLFAASTLATRSPGARWLGALALLGATLSRYEPWPVAAVFAAWNLARPSSEDAPTSERGRTGGAALRWMQSGAASLLAVAGPISWIAWNRLAHGDAFHFVARVTAYRRALGESASESMLARLVAYPGALVREMPEIVIPSLVVAVLAAMPSRRARVLPGLRACAAPLALAAVQVVALSLALVKDGAPTHHPERAVLFPALALVITCAATLPHVLRRAPTTALTPAELAPSEEPPRTPPRSRIAWLAIAGVLLARAAVMPAVARAQGPAAPGLGPHLVRLVTPREAFIDRSPEEDIGALAAREAPAGRPIFIAGVQDYAYFAIFAGSGRPDDFVLDREIDPRKPPTDNTPAALARRLRESGATHVIARIDGAGPTGVPALAPVARNSRYGVWPAASCAGVYNP